MNTMKASRKKNKMRKVLSFLMTVVMLLSNTTVYAAEGGNGYDKTAAETVSDNAANDTAAVTETAEVVSDNAAGGAEAEASETVPGNSAGGAETGEEAVPATESVPENVATGDGDEEWTIQAQDWYLDYQHSFHYFPEVKDAETGEITQREEYQLWLEKYAPRDEHKNDTEIVVPEYGAALHSEVWTDTTMWTGIDDKIIGYRTVLASKSSSGRGTYDSLWKAGENVITSITIEDGVTTQSDCSMMFWSMDELTELNISGLDTSNATNMHSMFASNENLKKLDLTSKQLWPFALPYKQVSWDTSNVTDMSSMFEWCLELEELTLGESFDTSNVTNMGNMFASLRSIKTLDLTMLDTSKVTSMTGMFQFCSEEITDDSWNVIGKKGLEEIRFGEKWNTENVESMYYMFNGCKNLKTLDVSGFDTSSVTTMNSMFDECEDLKTLDVSGFDTSKVADNGLMGMFCFCKSLESLNVGGFQIPEDAYVNMFRGSESLKEIDLSGWGDVKPKSMGSMFSGCSSLERVIWPTGLDTSAVTDMDYMFEGCKSLKSIDLSQFDTSNVTGMREMFEDCASLESIDVSSFDTANVNRMNNMFAGCKKLRSLDLRSFDFTTVNKKEYYTLERLVANSGIYALFLPKNAMSGYDFTSYANNCQSSGDDGTPLLRIYYAGSEAEWTALENKVGYSSYSWATISVVYDYTGDGNMWVTADNWYEDYNYELVGGAVLLLHSSKGTIESEFIEIPATTTIDGVVYQVKVDFVPSEESYYDGMWKQDKAKLLGIRFADGVKTTENCKFLFYDLENLQVLDIRGLDTSAATTMEGMFYYCSRLREFLPGEKFDTSNVTNMSGMFIHCHRLKTIDVSGFNTSKVTDMSSMFGFCNVVKELDLSGFDTAKVTDMDGMFSACHALTSLDVSGFNTAKVTNMGSMFSGCEKLTSLALTGFDTAKVSNMQLMFTDTNALEILDLRSFDFGKVRATEYDQRGDYVKTIIYNAGVKELYLPVDAMNYFDFTDEERKAPNLEKIYYVGTEAQWAELHNTLPAGVTITYNVEGFEKPGETVVPGLEDYRCTVDTENHIVSIHESKGTIKASSIVVPAHATIDGVSYQVVLDKDTDYDYSSLWCGEDRNVIRNIRFEEGVQVGEKSGYLFSYMRLNSLDVSGLDTSHTTDMHGMFANIYDLESLDVSMLDTSNVTNMNAMFEDLQSLKSLKLGSTNGSTVTYIDTSNVTNMFCMFRNCVSLPSIDLSRLDTSKAEDLEFMFENCSSLQSIDVSGFDTRKAKAVRGAFTECASLKTLDLRNWDFTRVNTTLYNNGGKYEGADAYYAAGLITDSGVMDLYLPVTFLQHLDMTLPAEWDGDTPVSSGNIAPNLRRVYYAGTQEEWDAQVVKLPATVELICNYTGGVVELPEYVEAVTLDQSTLTLKMGRNSSDPYTLTATITPADAKDTSVTWSCDNEDVVHTMYTKVVAENGEAKSQYTFMPWGTGTATVTVTANGAEPGKTVSASCTVTVEAPDGDEPVDPVTYDYVLSISLNESNISMISGKTKTLKATVAPANAEDTSVSWSSSNRSVAKVDANGTVTVVNAGTAVITATANGSEPGQTVSASCVVKVQPSQVEEEDFEEYEEDATFWLAGVEPEGYDYTGAAIKPDFRLYYGTTLLNAGTDYKVAYKNNKAVKVVSGGGALYDNAKDSALDSKAPSIVITLKGNYAGTMIRTFSIHKKDLSDEDIVVGNVSAVANGKSQKLKPVLYYMGKAISAKEYTLSGDGWKADGYSEVGNYTVTITASSDGNFTGGTFATVSLKEGSGMINLAKAKPVLSDSGFAFVYTGEELRPVYTIEGLEEDTDYTVSYENNIEVGKATVRFQATDETQKCYGSKSITFKISKPAPIKLDNNSSVKVELLDELGDVMTTPSAVYAKGGAMPKVKVTVAGKVLTEGTDYKLSYKNNKKVNSDAYVTVTGKGAYKGKATPLKFAVTPQDLSRLTLIVDDVVLDANLAKQKAYAYQKTNWTLTDLDGKALKMGTDFVTVKKGVSESHGTAYLAGSDKLAPGATVTLVLEAKSGGNYTGTISASYHVIAKDKSLKKAKVALKDSVKTRIAYEEGMPVELSESDLAVTLNGSTLDSSNYEIVSCTGNVQAGKKAKVTVRGKNGYGNMKTVTFTINPLKYTK